MTISESPPTEDPEVTQSVEWRRFAPGALVVVATLAAHGYEIVSFHLSIDEPWQAALGPQGWAEVWLGAGRWAMAGVSLLLPRQPGPAVPTAVGLACSALAWWWMTTRVLRMGPWPAAACVALAVSTPAYALIATYAGNIAGTGLGQLLVCGFAALLTGLLDRAAPGHRWRKVLLLIATAAVVAGLYEGLVPALALATALVAAARARVLLLAVGAATSAIGVLLSGALASVLRHLLDVPDAHYRESVVHLGALDDVAPSGLVGTAAEALRPFVVSTGRFGIDAPWVWIAVGVLLVCGVRRVVAGRESARPGAWWTVCLLVVTTAVMLLIATVTDDLPLRSQVFLPWVWLVLGLTAFGSGSAPDPETPADPGVPPGRIALGVGTVLVAGIVTLAVLSQASITNAIYLAGADRAERDQDLAFRIDEQRRLLGVAAPIPVVVRSDLEFGGDDSPIAPATESAGVSLLRGDPVFVSQYLLTLGIPVTTPSPADLARGQRLIDAMPVYPQRGCVQERDGLLLVRLVDGPGAR